MKSAQKAVFQQNVLVFLFFQTSFTTTNIAVPIDTTNMIFIISVDSNTKVYYEIVHKNYMEISNARDYASDMDSRNSESFLDALNQAMDVSKIVFVLLFYQ